MFEFVVIVAALFVPALIGVSFEAYIDRYWKKAPKGSLRRKVYDVESTTDG